MMGGHIGKWLHRGHNQRPVACSAELAGSTLAEASADISPVELHAGVGEGDFDQGVDGEGIHAAGMCGAGNACVLALMAHIHGVVGIIGPLSSNGLPSSDW